MSIDELEHEVEQLQALEKERQDAIDGKQPDNVRLPGGAKAVLVAFGVLATAVITLITTFGWVDWSAAQTALVGTEAAAVIGLISALVAHFWPDTPHEHVAIAATVTAVVSATLALGTGFVWWSMTQEEISALVAVITAVFGVGGAILARRNVFAGITPKR